MERKLRKWNSAWVTAALFTIVAMTTAWAQPGPLVITSNTTLTTDLSFSGNGIIIQGNNITLDGAGYTIYGPGTIWANGITSSGYSGVTIKNLHITGFAQGIALAYGSGSTIENCQIDAGSALQGNGSGGTVAGTSVLLYTVSNSVLHDNTINDFWRNIFIIYGSDNSVLENTLTRTLSIQTLSHIQLHESDRNQIIGNSISGTANNGVALVLYCDENRIEGNTLSGGMGVALGMSGYNTLPVDNSNNVFEDNTITGPWAGIQVSYLNTGATGNVFRGNVATGLILEGVFLFDVDGGVIVEENYLEGTEPSGYSTRGFHLNNTQWTDLRDNTAVNFDCGLIASLGSTDNLIRFNDLSGNSGAVGLAVDSVDNVFYGNLPDPLTVCSGGAPAPVQLSACDLITLCIEAVESLGLGRGITNNLLAKLEAGLKSCEGGNDNAAAGQLGAFVNAVEAQKGKKISDEDVTELLRCAIDAIRLL